MPSRIARIGPCIASISANMSHPRFRRADFGMVLHTDGGVHGQGCAAQNPLVILVSSRSKATAGEDASGTAASVNAGAAPTVAEALVSLTEVMID